MTDVVNRQPIAEKARRYLLAVSVEGTCGCIISISCMQSIRYLPNGGYLTWLAWLLGTKRKRLYKRFDAHK